MPTIYVALLNEGTDVWRPVLAEQLAGDRYRIVGQNDDPDDEQWEFETGSVVRCEFRRLSDRPCLVAVQASD